MTVNRLVDCGDPSLKGSEGTGRNYLVILRRFVIDLGPEALRRAIWLLSHAGSHPNILRTKDNWIPPHVEEQIVPKGVWSSRLRDLDASTALMACAIERVRRCMSLVLVK